MQELFKAAIERGASDIHIKTGDVIRARIYGELVPLTQQKLTADQVKGIAMKLIPHERDRQFFDTLLDYDCSWGLAGVGRFRVNIMRQRGSPMVVMRAIPFEIASLDDLGLPPMIKQISNH
jgi:twitching motility protein PilT